MTNKAAEDLCTAILCLFSLVVFVERPRVRLTFSRVPLLLQAVVKAQIGDFDDDPADQTSHGGDIHEPPEDNRSVVRDGEIYQRQRNAGHCDGPIRRAPSIASLKNLRGVAIAAQTE